MHEGCVSYLLKSISNFPGPFSRGRNSAPESGLVQWQASKESELAQQTGHQGDKGHLSHTELLLHTPIAENQNQFENEHGSNQLSSQPENCFVDRQQQSTVDPIQFIDNQVNISEQASAHCQILDRAQYSVNQSHDEHHLNGQQLSTVAQANNSMKRIISASIPSQQLLQKLQPHLDKDRYMQLQAVYNKLKVGLSA